MIFEFLVAYHVAEESDAKQAITQLLSGVLEDNQYDHGEVDPADLVQFRYERTGAERAGLSEASGQTALLGFVLILPDYEPSGEENERQAEDAQEDHNTLMSSIVDDFAKFLPEASPIFHALKFEDPLLRSTLAERAAEIFGVEMKLRRVLSLIYLHAYQSHLPYDLLREDRVSTTPPSLNSDQMIRAIENQFFHINFSQYIRLNDRTPIRFEDMMAIIKNSGDYDSFRAEILRNPIVDERDINFLADIRQLLDPIEAMRNCVAHNRRPTGSVVDNYPDALASLDKRLNQYLTTWQTS